MESIHDFDCSAQIKVVGIGGGGCNAVNRMCEEMSDGADFIAVNTDAQSLLHSIAPCRIRIGDALTRGLGAGGDPYLGQRAAEESHEDLYEVLDGADMVFLTAGLGGGTGTGGLPVIAEICRDIGALTVAIITKPFSFEGKQRMDVADDGVTRLKKKLDTLIVIPNDRLLATCEGTITVAEAFRSADRVLQQGIQAITELVVVPGEINLDFADVKTIMAGAGMALMSIGFGRGENRATDAAKAAISSPLLGVSMEGAKKVLFNITANDLTLFEVNEAASVIRQAADPDAQIIFGLVADPKMDLDVRITLIATGFATPESRVAARDFRLREPAAVGDLPDFLRRL